jgi:hypothetical protein
VGRGGKRENVFNMKKLSRMILKTRKHLPCRMNSRDKARRTAFYQNVQC